MTLNNTNAAEGRNAERAACADTAFITYGSVKEGNTTDMADFSSEDGEEQLTDLLTDLRHLARREGWNFADAVRIAENHFTAEVAEEGETDEPDEAPPTTERKSPPDLVTAARAVLFEAQGDIYSDADEVVPTLKRLWDALDALEAAISAATAAGTRTVLPPPDYLLDAAREARGEIESLLDDLAGTNYAMKASFIEREQIAEMTLTQLKDAIAKAEGGAA